MRESYTFQTVYQQIKTYKKELWLAVFYNIIATLILLPIPLLIPLLIDELILEQSDRLSGAISSIFGYGEAWFVIAVVVVAVLALRGIVLISSNLKNYYSVKISQGISYRLRLQILSHLERVGISEYESLKSGGVSAKKFSDIEGISQFVSQVVGTAIGALLMLLGIIAIIFWMNWILALLVILLNPFFFSYSKLLGRKMGKLLLLKYKAYEVYQELMTETLELLIQVRTSNQERTFFGLLEKKAKEIEDTSVNHGYQAIKTQNASAMLTNIAVDIFRGFALIAVLYSDLSLGMMLAFLFYLSTLVSPTQQLASIVTGYYGIKPAFTRLDELLSLAQEPSYDTREDPFEDQITTSVVLESIFFSYPNGKEVLHDLSFEAKRGQKVALIGPSGGGKSTIAQLLVGLYEPQGGEIRYGGVSIKDIGLPKVRDNVALMLQDSFFFDDTIRMNLTFGIEKTDEEINKALYTAQLYSFVDRLEEGLETQIGKNGIRLSGGQKQRLAIARLILSDPKIVIFDEATSALDGETEYLLFETLKPFLKDRTTIIIAHRTTTIKQAEYIYLIEEGRVKAEGEQDLLQAQGLIREDYDVQ